MLLQIKMFSVMIKSLFKLRNLILSNINNHFYSKYLYFSSLLRKSSFPTPSFTPKYQSIALNLSKSSIISRKNLSFATFQKVPSNKYCPHNQLCNLFPIDPSDHKKMNMKTPWHTQSSKTKFSKISQSIEFQLTPTTLRQQDKFQESSSMLSLSNYLQQEDSSLCFNKKLNNQSRTSKNQISITHKNRLFLDCFDEGKRYLLNQHSQFHEQESQSLLLLDSTIKQNRILSQKTQNDNEIQLQIKSQIDEKSEFPSRIYQKNSKSMHPCADSIQLLQLLAIPKENEQSRQTGQKISNSQLKTKQRQQQLVKIDNFYQNMVKSNQKLFNEKVHSISCQQCLSLQKRINCLQSFLSQSQKQIQKYETLIQKLNSNIFDLKIQNKRLSFENLQFSRQIQRYLMEEQSSFKSKKKNLRIKSLMNLDDFQDNNLKEQSKSFNLLNEDDNVRSSAYTKYSRTLHNFGYTRNDLNDYNMDINFKQSQYIPDQQFTNDQKIYPQTPMPTSNYLKYNRKHSRKQSNHSDKIIDVSISQVKEPIVYQINERDQQGLEKFKQIENVLRQKRKCVHKSDKNIMRFSDLSKEMKENVAYSNENCNLIHRQQNISSNKKSPLKNHGFLKNKSKSPIQNLKNHPINMISKEDNSSQASQTKTQKLYGLKNSFQSQDPTFEQNDYNLMNFKIHEKVQESNKINRNSFKTNGQKDKNGATYKSFKQIGSLYENQIRKNSKKPLEKEFSTQKYPDYGMALESNKDSQRFGMLRTRQKSQRNFYSPSPNSFATRRQADKVLQMNSPYSKPQSDIKNFLR